LGSYYPADGWSWEVKESGPEEIKVEFTRGEDDSKLEAVCVNGIPTLGSDSGDDGGGGRGGGDHGDG
jgi:hypothetical protein